MKILKEYFESEYYERTKKIQFLYHSVFSDKSYEFVKKNGIMKDQDGYVYLSEKPISNPLFPNTVAVFKVKIPDNNKLYDWREIWWDNNGNEFDSDHQYDESNPFYVYQGNIPLKYIEEIKF